MKFLFTFFICLIFAIPLSAQNYKQRSEQVETVKIAFITQKLKLNTSEAEKFWPVYNSYQKDMKEVLKLRKNLKNDEEFDQEDKFDNELEFESRLLETRKKYKQEFTKVVPSQKVAMFFQAEREFRERLIKELRERRKN
ncbi:MAG: hypothetical protein H7096_00135 [Flavobacterium sp.]|nr:hypothetical protein [Pedobacter sp.]